MKRERDGMMERDTARERCRERDDVMERDKERERWHNGER